MKQYGSTGEETTEMGMNNLQVKKLNYYKFISFHKHDFSSNESPFVEMHHPPGHLLGQLQ